MNKTRRKRYILNEMIPISILIETKVHIFLVSLNYFFVKKYYIAISKEKDK